MKRLLLFFLLMTTSLFIFADVTKSITMMIGTSVTINPYQDGNETAYYYAAMDYSLYYESSSGNYYSDNSSISIDAIEHTIKNTNSGISGSTKSYYTYELTALRRGTYKMVVKIYRKYDQVAGFTDYKINYNINVVDVTQINMPSALNLQPGETYTLNPQILEVGATSELTWTSSNTGVAIVDQTGKIRTLRTGTTNITCTAYNGVSATCKLTVVPVIAEAFALEETAFELEPGETAMLNPIFTPTNTTDQSVTYKSSNTNVATVDAEGMVTAVNMGTCKITATTNDGSNMSAICNITVKPIVTFIFLQSTMETMVGQSSKLEPVIQQEGASTTLIWRSSNTSVATVSDDGTVYGVSAGTATITCTSANNVSASCDVTVKPLPNYLSITNVSGTTNSQIVLPVMMYNENDITAFQFELSLPAGVTLSECQLTNRKSGHTVGFEMKSNGNYQITAFSTSSDAFSGSEGAVVYLTLSVAPSVAIGTHDIAIKNIEMTTTNGIAINPVDVNAIMTISNVKIGDTNGDGKISITDAVSIVNYILGNASDNFVYAAADVNGDNKVSITDAVAVVNMILNGTNQQAKPREFSYELDPQ